MKLADLDPKLWAAPGRCGQGIVFLCPHCRLGFICVAFANPLDGGEPWDIGTPQRRPISELWDLLYGGLTEPRGDGVIEKGTWVVPPGTLWQRTGASVDTLTLSPSVDASAAGCWHGFVQGGEIR